jgi:hypothetical protein
MAFRNALIDLKYGYNPIGSSVVFTFDGPKTYQPRRDPARLAEFLAVFHGNVGLVARYKSLGLGSNDPNLVTGDAAGLVSDFISLYSRSFFNQVWAILHKEADRTLVEVLKTIVKLFRP